MRKAHDSLHCMLFGVIIGAIIGFLLAPASGEETRKKLHTIKKDNDDLIKKTTETTESLIAKTMDAIEKGFDKISQNIDEKKSSNKPFAKKKGSK